jgi:hypothetical protein
MKKATSTDYREKMLNDFKFSDVDSFSYHFATNYIFSTTPFSAIYHDLLLLSYCLYELISSLIKIFFLTVLCFVLIILKTFVFLLPHARSVASSVYIFHQNLCLYDIAIELCFITCVLLGFSFRKRIRGLWKVAERSISARSKAAARIVPHVMYFSGALFVGVVGRKFILPLTSVKMMPVFTLVLPLARLLLILAKEGLGALDVKQYHRYRHIFVTVVIIGIYHSVVTCLSVIPFSNYLLSVLPYIKETVIVVLLWVQYSHVFASIVFSTLIQPVMDKISRMIPLLHDGYSGGVLSESEIIASSGNQKNFFLALLQRFNVLDAKYSHFLLQLLQDSVVTILSLLFLFFPYPFSIFGLVTVAFILPSFRSISVVNKLNVFRMDTIRRNSVRSSNEESAAELEITKQYLHQSFLKWTHYWICIFTVWLVRIYLFNFWASVLILVSLWLQHSFFNGATKVYSQAVVLFQLLSTPNTLPEGRSSSVRELHEAEQESDLVFNNVQANNIINDGHSKKE